jgi:hypothetical protein
MKSGSTAKVELAFRECVPAYVLVNEEERKWKVQGGALSKRTESLISKVSQQL